MILCCHFVVTQTEESKKQALAHLNMDGCSLEDMDLYFVLPGSENIELCKGGRDLQVTTENLEEYLQVRVVILCLSGLFRIKVRLKYWVELVFLSRYTRRSAELCHRYIDQHFEK